MPSTKTKSAQNGAKKRTATTTTKETNMNNNTTQITANDIVLPAIADIVRPEFSDAFKAIPEMQLPEFAPSRVRREEVEAALQSGNQKVLKDAVEQLYTRKQFTFGEQYFAARAARELTREGKEWSEQLQAYIQAILVENYVGQLTAIANGVQYLNPNTRRS